MLFSISTEPSKKLVRIEVAGMLTVADIAELYRQEQAAIREMGCELGAQVALVDVRECPLQLQEIVAAFQSTMSHPTRARKVAMVAGGALSRLQAKRILQRDDAAIFVDVGEAESWLFS